MNDLMALKGFGNEREGLSQYEQIKVGRRPSGTAIAGLAVGIGGAVVGVASWFYAHAQAKRAQEVAAAKNDGLRDLVNANYVSTNATLDRLARTLERETDARVNGDINLTTTINDTVSGSQQGTLTAQQQAELSAIQTATQTVTAGLMTGQYSQNPMKVVRVSGQRECGCDSCGCGCN